MKLIKSIPTIRDGVVEKNNRFHGLRVSDGAKILLYKTEKAKTEMAKRSHTICIG